jgi:hypothetical protein
MGFGWVHSVWVWWVCQARDLTGNPRGFGGSGHRWSGYGSGLVVRVGICRRICSLFLSHGFPTVSGSGLGSELVVGVRICSLFLSPEFLGRPT